MCKEWNDFLNAWEILSAQIVDIRRSSVKDKFGKTLLAKLDVSYQKKGYYYFFFFLAMLNILNTFYNIKLTNHNFYLYYTINDFFLDLRTSYILKILLISYLIPTKTQIKIFNSTGQSKYWKPSLLESVSAFATHVTVS